MGSGYKQYIDGFIQKVSEGNYTIVGKSKDPLSGFAAFAIKTPENEVIVAARGTEFDHLDLDALKDLLTDAGLAMKYETLQHQQMENFVNTLEGNGYSNFYFTGHSLGGNLAIHGATAVDDPGNVKGVYSFNASGFNELYWTLNGWKLRQIKNIVNYQNEYDYVSSIMRVPGKKVVVKSSFSGNHGGVDDHSICNYAINEDGSFQPNSTGKKRLQTLVGVALGELGQNLFKGGLNTVIRVARFLYNRTAKVYLTRDFSDSSKKEMLEMVTQVDNSNWRDFTDWVVTDGTIFDPGLVN